jgi:hypothetical protein
MKRNTSCAKLPSNKLIKCTRSSWTLTCAMQLEPCVAHSLYCPRAIIIGRVPRASLGTCRSSPSTCKTRTYVRLSKDLRTSYCCMPHHAPPSALWYTRARICCTQHAPPPPHTHGWPKGMHTNHVGKCSNACAQASAPERVIVSLAHRNEKRRAHQPHKISDQCACTDVHAAVRSALGSLKSTLQVCTVSHSLCL